MKISQFNRETVLMDGKQIGCYTYTEFGSKNRQGGVRSLNLENKVVKQFENEANPQRCHVKILDKYLDLIPAEAKDSDVFYLTPLSKKPDELGKPWFTCTPVGRNRLNAMMKEMCKVAEFDTTLTNHSLRAYGATKMFQAKVPEKLIQQRTGHKSLEALRRYERTSLPQLLDVSTVMDDHTVAPVSVMQTASTSCTTTTSENPTIVFKGCTFTGCAISMSGQASNENTYEHGIQDLFKGIDMDDVFND